jgi:hypothetical protein
MAVALFVFWTHRANIERLRNGEEHRFGKKGRQPKRPVAMIAVTAVIVAAVAIAARFA